MRKTNTRKLQDTQQEGNKKQNTRSKNKHTGTKRKACQITRRDGASDGLQLIHGETLPLDLEGDLKKMSHRLCRRNSKSRWPKGRPMEESVSEVMSLRLPRASMAKEQKC